MKEAGFTLLFSRLPMPQGHFLAADAALGTGGRVRQYADSAGTGGNPPVPAAPRGKTPVPRVPRRRGAVSAGYSYLATAVCATY